MKPNQQARKFLLTAILFSILGLQVFAQSDQKPESLPTSYWPKSVSYSDAITPPKKFFGFEIGQRHLEHAQLVAYMQQLAKESDRIHLAQYGKTHGGRPLLLLTISSPKNLGRIQEIKKSHRQLANPKFSSDVDIANLPAVINMGYGVHGDEASATNCSALVAYYLAAATGDEIEKWLSNCLILLDPSLNPDGFNRFANWVNGYRGRIPNADPQHREHNQGWPSGRVNYYWFDLNRDWLPLEHPESRARMRWYHAWKPNVVLDFHEMGTDTTYFFQPGVPNRTNPFTPRKNIELTAKFGEYHGKALDQAGSFYFTQERFDDFYMGKGSTYPDLHGAVGILFEQASARGHVQKNQDGRLTFHKAIANHFVTSLSSLRATSDLRDDLLVYKRSFYRESLEQAGSQKKKYFVFSLPNNRTRLQTFAEVLLRHDIVCFWPKQDMQVEGKHLLANQSLIVPVVQSEYRFLKSLLMRKKQFKENIFYDVSSWTLPLAYGLKQTVLRMNIDKENLVPAKLNAKSDFDFDFDPAAIAYIVRCDDDSSGRSLNRLLVNNVNVKVATRPFTAIVSKGDEAESFDSGSLLIQMSVAGNRPKLVGKLLDLAAKNGADVRNVYSGMTPEGVDLGSDRFRKLRKPSIVMPVGKGIAQYEAGEIWHLLDVKHGMQLTMLNSERFAKYDLRPYTTFVFPTGRYSQWNSADWEPISAELRNGATAIAFGSTCELVKNRLVANEEDQEDADKEIKNGQKEVQKRFDSAARTRALKLISGAIFQTRIDRSNPLYYGFPNDRLAVFRNHSKFLKPSDNPYCNPGIYDEENPHLAGYCSDENVEKFKKSASVVVVPHGKGRIVMISDNPNFRAYWHGTARVFVNAIFFGDFANP